MKYGDIVRTDRGFAIFKSTIENATMPYYYIELMKVGTTAILVAPSDIKELVCDKSNKRCDDCKYRFRCFTDEWDSSF